jgi:hypothetical protein
MAELLQFGLGLLGGIIAFAVTFALLRKEVSDLRRDVDKLERQRHDVVMPTLRWLESEGMMKCKWERSESLRR